MSRSALYGRAPPVRSRRHVRIRRGFGPCLQPRTAGALPWQRPRDREPWVWIACVRPFTPSVIKSGLVVSRDTETEGFVRAFGTSYRGRFLAGCDVVNSMPSAAHTFVILAIWVFQNP